jgi:hypothetical protein
MKKYSALFAIVALVLASLACQTLMGGDNNDFTPPPVDGGDVATPTAIPESSDDGGVTVGGESEFPITSDAFNVVSSSGTVTYQTKLSGDDVQKFYRDEFANQGYAEDTSMAITFGSTFTMVFTGHESGKSIYVVGADAGDGSIYITITLA